ncbi:MAG: hypothetical protein ACYDD1_18895 [Caulobacteraceae bacterium]
MRLADRARRLARACRIPIRRPASAGSVDHLIADIKRKLLAMEPSADAQAIINQVNALPAAITAQVASEVTTAEAAKDAQRAADIAAIGAAVTAISAGITPAA